MDVQKKEEPMGPHLPYPVAQQSDDTNSCSSDSDLEAQYAHKKQSEGRGGFAIWKLVLIAVGGVAVLSAMVYFACCHEAPGEKPVRVPGALLDRLLFLPEKTGDQDTPQTAGSVEKDGANNKTRVTEQAAGGPAGPVDAQKIEDLANQHMFRVLGEVRGTNPCDRHHDDEEAKQKLQEAGESFGGAVITLLDGMKPGSHERERLDWYHKLLKIVFGAQVHGYVEEEGMVDRTLRLFASVASFSAIPKKVSHELASELLTLAGKLVEFQNLKKSSRTRTRFFKEIMDKYRPLHKYDGSSRDGSDNGIKWTDVSESDFEKLCIWKRLHRLGGVWVGDVLYELVSGVTEQA